MEKSRRQVELSLNLEGKVAQSYECVEKKGRAFQERGKV